ncbi:MAG: cell division protein FtsL [Terriglobales bacterium]
MAAGSMAAGGARRARMARQGLGGGLNPVRRGAPEIYFAKAIDNSRVVQVADRERNREMAMFFGAVCVLFALVMVYAWQHFGAIEYGYRIEAQKAQRDALLELNRALRLEEASLRDPERIDALARRMGLQSPQAGQVFRLDSHGADLGAPVVASASAVSVVSPMR